MRNANGSLGSRATQQDHAEVYATSCIYQLTYLSDVVDEHWEWYVATVVQAAVKAAHHGRKALRQKTSR